MNPEVLQALVKWLEGLAGYDPSEPVKTKDDLRAWASHVARCEEHRITNVDFEAVTGLIDDLAPPEEKAREARRANSE
jgi:hypothetical protein